MITHVFDVSIEQDEDGRWTAECPALPGCVTWGKSKQEAINNIREAIELYIEHLVELGKPVPRGREVIGSPAISVVTG